MPSAKHQTLSSPPVPTLSEQGKNADVNASANNNNALRTFMTRLTGALQSLFGPSGGQYIDNPNGLFYNTTSQTLAATNTGYPITFNMTYLSNYVSIVDSSKITVSVGGIYNFQYSGSLNSGSSSSKNVFVWITRNGTTIGYSCAPYTLSGSGTYGRMIWNFTIDMQEGDYIQLYWAASDTNVTLATVGATSPHPAIPASVCAVMYSSALPETLPTPP